MDTVLIEKIIKMFEIAKISHLELELDNLKIKLDKGDENKQVVTCSDLEPLKQEEKKEESKVSCEGNLVKSPLVGIFYQAPSTDSKPFVSVGDKVKKGDKLCIIEAMKVMNEIVSPYDGVIKEIYSKNQGMVEYDSPLFRIEA